ncbi:MAG: bifunctional hydroxymethylpyrimidine kinase/phosphomethylpyrimidine kinase, partial [Enterococcus viikkiensis]
MTKTILTIAGSDTLAGGGLQSDLKTFEDYRLFGLTAITCIAVMKDNQFEIHDLPTNLLQDQLDTIKQEVDLSAIKLGLIHEVTALSIVKNFLQSFDGP